MNTITLVVVKWFSCFRWLWSQGFERDQEGSLSPVFGLGASLCPLCGQVQKKSFGKDGPLSFPNSTKVCSYQKTY